MATDSYVDHVLSIEAAQDLAPYAKRSFESFSSTFVDGAPSTEYFERIWSSDNTAPKLKNRTPLQIERDRILHSNLLRKQTDKYHVLYSGDRRIVRNYTTHTMRLTQVVRSICRPLGLNSDFAEALALGIKAGATPFIHVSKVHAEKWLRKKLAEIDKEKDQDAETSAREELQLSLFSNSADTDASEFPSWINSLRSDYVISRVKKYIPWARGEGVDTAYSSGQESYWLLTTNPFVREARQSKFFPETVYGIWRHSIEHRPTPNSFHHRAEVEAAKSGYHDIQWHHASYEAAVVQYADDITWAIENLNDANRVMLASGEETNLFEMLYRELPEDTVQSFLLRALSAADSGQLYTYFIERFVSHAREVFDRLGEEGQAKRTALRDGVEAAFLTLDDQTEEHLKQLKLFLQKRVFEQKRLKHRTQMLSSIVSACLDILYEGSEDILLKMAEERGRVERWAGDTKDKAKSLLRDDVHRSQLVLDIFAEMSDQEIYDFVGIQSL